ncbi:HEAT repeat domain-containing protein [Methanocrinis sp.]|uniref:HEAT repeat domain-containing protein n=1 Tax=Methanocrinis sp. TaxID=3101522 RepID=UPI003D13EE51
MVDIRGVEPLIEALKDDHKYVRRNAAIALRRIGDSRAVDALTRVGSSGKESLVREAAAEALERLGAS